MALSLGTGFPGVLPDWTNLDVIHRNTLPPRAHFYPYANEKAALSFNRSESEIHDLSGLWKFHYDPSPWDAPAWETANVTDWDDIEVPGMWQRQGYGAPQYTNIDYPFPVMPPNVSYVNPTGSYWRDFDVPEDWSDDQQIRLRFEGVDSAFHVWVNGEEVGYSQGSRDPHEFDITDYLSGDGGNSVAVRVYQWSDASYLEDQDQWWLSGIFREVYLVPFSRSAIVDYRVTTDVDDDFESATLYVNVTTQGDKGDLRVKLLEPGGKELDDWTGPPSQVYKRKIEGDDFALWSAENPHLYTVLISFNGRVISQKVGLRRVEIVGSNFHVNGKPITIYGVNKHEHHPQGGRTVPYDFAREDLKRVKRANVNTIRLSHQPPHPDVLALADELGLYVIAETDLECHGFLKVTTDENAHTFTTSNPDWEEAYVYRVRQLVERYKNHASIIIWSLGNECFYGSNIEAMASWLRDNDRTRVTQYEPDKYAESVDMYSQMYPSPDQVRQFIGEHSDKPFILCEFAHARGNGPGGLLEYVQLFRDEPTVQGGLVWEWNNHGLLKTEGDVTYYAYGGDFGDEPNDGVGIMDGLLSSNRTWMPAITEYAKIIQPVNVTLTADNRVLIKNHYDFSDLSGLDATWYIVQDGKDDTKPQQWDLPRIRGGESLTVELPLNGTTSSNSSPSREAWLTVEFRLKEDTVWAKKGHLIAWDQLHLKPSSSSQRRDIFLAGRKTDLDVSRKNQTHLSIAAGSSTIGFDLVRGNVTWNVDGVDLFQRGPELYFYRAQTQKDANADGPKWEEAKVGMMSTNVRDVSWKETEDGLEVHYKVFVAPKVLNWGAEADLTWTVVNTGDTPSLRVHVKGDFVGDKTPVTVPRIGLLAVLPGEFKDVSWFGRGPGESYKDSKQAGRFGRYESTVEGLFTHYDIPQENGNREDLRWVQLGTSGLTLDARRTDDQPFSFTVQRYSPFDLTDATHPQDLKPLDITVLNLDFNNNGLGSAGPGPGPFSQYRCWTDPFDFTFEFSLV